MKERLKAWAIKRVSIGLIEPQPYYGAGIQSISAR